MNSLTATAGWHQYDHQWKDEVIMNDGDSFFSDLCDRITQAKKCVEIETYIFDLDHLGLKMLALMAEAAKRGIEVRLLIDGVGCSQWNHDTAETYRKQGINIRFFHPLPWQKSSKKFWQSVGIRSFIFGWRKLQRRNHRKLYIVDQEIAFVGSMNISDRHLTSQFHDLAWRDTGVRLSGKGLEALTEAFQITWKASDPPWKQAPVEKIIKLFSRHERKVLLNYTFMQRRHYHAALLHRIGEAKTRIWITNPYFVPDSKLMRILLKKAGQIDVQFLFPKKNDFFGVQYAMESRYSTLLKSGAKIYTYLPSMMHAKIIMIDELLSIGSSNLDHLSLFQNYEADVVISRLENKQLAYEQFAKDLTQSEEIQLEVWKKRPFLQKILEQIFYRFRVFL